MTSKRSRRISTPEQYRDAPERSKSAHKKALDVTDAWDKRAGKRSLSAIAREKRTTLETYKAHVKTRKVGSRVVPAPPSERRLYRGRMGMVADVEGRPEVRHVTPSTDADRRAIERHDKAVFASAVKGDDALLLRTSRRAIVDQETGDRLRLFADPDELRDAVDTGEVDLQELFYSGGGTGDLDLLLAQESQR